MHKKYVDRAESSHPVCSRLSVLEQSAQCTYITKYRKTVMSVYITVSYLCLDKRHEQDHLLWRNLDVPKCVKIELVIRKFDV